MKGKVLCVSRAERFSPNSVENDRRILEQVAEEVRNAGCEVTMLTEEELVKTGELPKADTIFCMTRSEEALAILRQYQARIINHPDGIALCDNRSSLNTLMEQNQVPVPPTEGPDGVWLKKASGTTQVKADTVFCCNEEEVAAAMADFASRGITDVCRQAHIPGDLVKFYGVAGTTFFYYLYPTDAKRSKFGLEEKNGEAHHYAFSEKDLKAAVDRLANAIGVLVYGGDAIVREDGSFVLIDFNDWPTFSPCREEAAKAIASHVIIKG